MIHAVETNQDNKIEVEDSGVRGGGGTGGLCWEGCLWWAALWEHSMRCLWQGGGRGDRGEELWPGWRTELGVLWSSVWMRNWLGLGCPQGQQVGIQAWRGGES